MTLKLNVLESYFVEKVNNLSGRNDTKAYITSTLLKYKTATYDLSKEILILEYAKAKEKNDFSIYQNLADWILFVGSIHPNSLKEPSEGYYYSIAQVSYYKCYTIVNKSWPLFEEMADRLPQITYYLRDELKKA